MGTLTVYDPPMCCATGVCGPEVDPKLARFVGDLDWLRARGVKVERINLAQEPGRLAENCAVEAVLDRSGGDELPRSSSVTSWSRPDGIPAGTNSRPSSTSRAAP